MLYATISCILTGHILQCFLQREYNSSFSGDTVKEFKATSKLHCVTSLALTSHCLINICNDGRCFSDCVYESARVKQHGLKTFDPPTDLAVSTSKTFPRSYGYETTSSQTYSKSQFITNFIHLISPQTNMPNLSKTSHTDFIDDYKNSAQRLKTKPSGRELKKEDNASKRVRQNDNKTSARDRKNDNQVSAFDLANETSVGDWKNDNDTSADGWNNDNQTSVRDWKNENQTAERDWKNDNQTAERDWKNDNQTAEHDWKNDNQTSARDWKHDNQTAERDWKNDNQTAERDWKNDNQTSARDWKNENQNFERGWKNENQTPVQEFENENKTSARDWQNENQTSELDVKNENKTSALGLKNEKQITERDWKNEKQTSTSEAKDKSTTLNQILTDAAKDGNASLMDPDATFIQTKYRIVTQTGSQEHSDTNCYVHIHVIGGGGSEFLYLNNPEDEMAIGSNDTFLFNSSQNIGNITKMKLDVAKYGISPGWFVVGIEIEREIEFEGSSYMEIYYTSINKWFQRMDGLNFFKFWPSVYEMPYRLVAAYVKYT